MKKTITTLFLFITISLFSQPYQTIQNIYGRSERQQGVYYKDIDNVFDNFEGTYLYEGNGVYFKMIFQKKELSSANGYYWEDMVIGGYQYKKDGVEIINCLDDINTFLENGRLYNLDASSILAPEHNKFCDDCLPEKWLRGWITDPTTGKICQLYIARKVQGSQEGLELWFRLEAGTKQPGESDDPIQLPLGQFFVTKIVD